jgi:hypothetical protein
VHHSRVKLWDMRTSSSGGGGDNAVTVRNVVVVGRHGVGRVS